MPKGWRPNKSQIAAIRELVASDERIEKIAELFGTTPRTLRKSTHTRHLFVKGGDYPKIFTDQERDFVISAASIDMPITRIADALNISRDTLRRHFMDEIDNAKTRKLASVGAALFRVAEAGDVRACESILRAKAGWNDRQVVEVEVETPTDQRMRVREEVGRLSREGRQKLREVLSELSPDLPSKAGNQGECPCEKSRH